MMILGVAIDLATGENSKTIETSSSINGFNNFKELSISKIDNGSSSIARYDLNIDSLKYTDLTTSEIVKVINSFPEVYDTTTSVINGTRFHNTEYEIYPVNAHIPDTYVLKFK